MRHRLRTLPRLRARPGRARGLAARVGPGPASGPLPVRGAARGRGCGMLGVGVMAGTRPAHMVKASSTATNTNRARHPSSPARYGGAAAGRGGALAGEGASAPGTRAGPGERGRALSACARARRRQAARAAAGVWAHRRRRRHRAGPARRRLEPCCRASKLKRAWWRPLFRSARSRAPCGGGGGKGEAAQRRRRRAGAGRGRSWHAAGRGRGCAPATLRAGSARSPAAYARRRRIQA